MADVTRQCTADGCERKRQARGLCGTHYSVWQRSQPGYQRKRNDRTVDITCERCGKVVAILAYHAKAQRYCSLVCAQNKGKATDLVLYVAPPRPSAIPVIGKGLWTSGQCRICSAWFISEHFDVTCSPECMKVRKREQSREHEHRRRARKRNAYVAPVYRRRVYELDGYRCHLCGKRCDKTKVVPHPMAPTIDHVIPLAAGGTHEPANCRTACFQCNASKGDRGGGEQLALLG